MNAGSLLVVTLSMVAVSVAVHVVAWPRPGRFLLVRAADGERARRATWRVHAVTATGTLAALGVVLLASAPAVQAAACGGAMLLGPLWSFIELVRLVRAAPLTPASSRFSVPLETPSALRARASPLLWALNVAALLAAPVALRAGWAEDPWPSLPFFAPWMLFLTGLVAFSVWGQVSERVALPASEQARYASLLRERRSRSVRLLELGLLCWNVAGALMWVSVGAGEDGPGYAGGAVAVLVGGPALMALVALQLPRLTQLADELAALAGSDALGTRQAGWRLGGLVYWAANDPALFVPSRSGLGQTLNLGRPVAWLAVATLVLGPLAVTLLALISLPG